MLDRLSGGRFKSTPHRVRNKANHSRLSWPFFFDPNWDTKVVPLPLDHLPPAVIKEDQLARWDKASVHNLSGTYGDYLMKKVSKVFPDLANSTGIKDQTKKSLY
jgi:isopenicillin N synthase-like dioxygenase